MMKYYIQQNYPGLGNEKQRSEDELWVIVKEALGLYIFRAANRSH